MLHFDSRETLLVRTVKITATITTEGLLTARVPSDLAPGDHEVVLVISEPPIARARPLDLPVVHLGSWPDDLSLSREDMYGDWGR
jgi:hypothetical protein